MCNSGIVFNIQKFTVHDGPGIRTELFLKGCPLRCQWCGNPESFKVSPEIGVYPSNCIGISKCGDCVSACDRDAIIVEDDKVIGINRDLCDDCLQCEKVCPSDVLKLWGEKITVDQAMKQIEDDVDFYEKSGGGVTISGGEALIQHKFTEEVLRRCKEKKIHTCLETALHVKKRVFEDVMKYTDMVITDIKHLNSAIHRKFTGVKNELMLENIKKLSTYDKPYIIRIPIIPGFNDEETQIDAIGDFILNELDNKPLQIQLLRFRPLGVEKYKSIGLPYNMGHVNMDREVYEKRVKDLAKLLKAKGLPAVAGTTNKFKELV